MPGSHRVFLHGNTNMFLGQFFLFHLIVHEDQAAHNFSDRGI